MNRYELVPEMYTQKSYGNKAIVEIQENGDKHLISYVTHVATITADGKAEIYDTTSSTTVKHIKDFLYQHDFDLGKSTKDLRNMYMKGLE